MLLFQQPPKDDTLPNGVTSEVYQIEKYGGYYVARFEASLPDTYTEDMTKTFSNNNNVDIGKAQSKIGKIVWNNICYNNAKIVSEAVISNEYVQSGLITGTAWDTMLKFIETAGEEYDTKSNSTMWGNYADNYSDEFIVKSGYYKNSSSFSDLYKINYINAVSQNYSKTDKTNLLLQTGAFGSIFESGLPKNLYDVAGNLHEWSAEIVAPGVNKGIYVQENDRVLRGGSFNQNGKNMPASIRYGVYSASSCYNYEGVGFRFILYIK